MTVILSGDVLEIEFRDHIPSERVDVPIGYAEWQEPSDRVHRAVNTGQRAYEEITTFFLDRPDAVHQPQA